MAQPSKYLINSKLLASPLLKTALTKWDTTVVRLNTTSAAETKRSSRAPNLRCCWLVAYRQWALAERNRGMEAAAVLVALV